MYKFCGADKYEDDNEQKLKTIKKLYCLMIKLFSIIKATTTIYNVQDSTYIATKRMIRSPDLIDFSYLISIDLRDRATVTQSRSDCGFNLK